MDASKRSIKIVNREQRALRAQQQDVPEFPSQLRTETQSRREMAKTVNSWIEETKRSKRKIGSLPLLVGSD